MPPNKSPLRRWFFRAFCLTPLMLVLWWGLLADGYLTALRYFANALLPHFFSKGLQFIQPFHSGGWVISTGLNVVGKSPAEEFLFQLDKARYLNRTVMGFPLLWALVLATKKNWFLPVVQGSLLLTALCLTGIAGYIWGVLATVLNPGDALSVRIREAPNLTVIGEPYSQITHFLASVAFFGQSLTVPVIGPVLIWAVLCRDEIKRWLT